MMRRPSMFTSGIVAVSCVCTFAAALIGSSCASSPEPEVSPEPTISTPLLEQRGKVSPVKETPPSSASVADSVSLNFDDDEIGVVPASFNIVETASRGTVAKWATKTAKNAPSPPNVFGAVETKNAGGTYNLALVEESSFLDVDVSVSVQGLVGKEDRGGGPVWRAEDADNYYIARWNPLENNFRIYFVKDGKRKQLASTVLKLNKDAWHTIRIVMIGEQITGWLDGDKVLETKDGTFSKSGMVGLWTKADAVTFFDDLTAVQVKRSK